MNSANARTEIVTVSVPTVTIAVREHYEPRVRVVFRVSARLHLHPSGRMLASFLSYSSCKSISFLDTHSPSTSSSPRYGYLLNATRHIHKWNT